MDSKLPGVPVAAKYSFQRKAGLSAASSGLLDLVVDLFGIAARNQVERALGQRRLELHDGGGAGLGLLWLLARQFQHALDVRHVFLAQFKALASSFR